MEPIAQRSDARRHRKKLIESAAKVFARDGGNAPLENVLVEAGLGRGTLYRHFKDRESLAAATLELPLDELASFVRSHRDDETLLWQFLLHHRQLASLYFASSVVASAFPHNEIFDNVQSAADQIYKEVLQRSVAAGVVDKVTSVKHLRLVMRMLINLDTRNEDTLQARCTMEGAMHILLRGLQEK